MRARTGAPLHVHPDDAPFLKEGRRPPPDRSNPLGRVMAMVSKKGPKVEVDLETFVEGDVLAVAGGISVLHTPGHSPGHCSFVHPRSGVLITGDALFNLRHKITYSFSPACTNVALSKDTAERLGDADYEIAAFTHGTEITAQAKATVRAFLLARRRAR